MVTLPRLGIIALCALMLVIGAILGTAINRVQYNCQTTEDALQITHTETCVRTFK